MTATTMKDAAIALLEGLTDEDRALVHLPFDDPRREIWMYWPREMRGDTYSGVDCVPGRTDGGAVGEPADVENRQRELPAEEVDPKSTLR